MMGGSLQGRGSDQVGQTVASYPTYEGAQKAVSALIAAEIPAKQIAIVGLGLRSIERVTGRLGYATAARSGAINGLLIGLFFSAIVVLGAPTVPIQVFVGVLFLGVAVGMLLSIVTYTIIRRRRDFASVMQIAADHYEVTVDAASAGKARQALGAGSVPAPSTRAQAPVSDEPPRYGERIGSPRPPAETPAPPGSVAPPVGAPPVVAPPVAVPPTEAPPVSAPVPPAPPAPGPDAPGHEGGTGPAPAGGPTPDGRRDSV